MGTLYSEVLWVTTIYVDRRSVSGPSLDFEPDAPLNIVVGIFYTIEYRASGNDDVDKSNISVFGPPSLRTCESDSERLKVNIKCYVLKSSQSFCTAGL